MIKCYVINLDYRKDRLDNITEHLNSNGLEFKRFSAIDAQKADDFFLSKNIESNGPLGKISRGDLACFQSHYCLWKKIAKSETGPVLILEDDVEITKLGFKIIKNLDWIPSDAKIIKCEKFGNKKHRILVSPVVKSFFKFNLHFLLSKHSGTGGYIITPNGAKFLIEKSKNVNVPVDHFLFNPNNSIIFNDLNPFQILPAICEQIDSSSNIHKYREGFSFNSVHDIIRELIRGYYEIRLLPKQIFQLIFMKCRLVKVIVSD